jgi:hypothetical protein
MLHITTQQQQMFLNHKAHDKKHFKSQNLAQNEDNGAKWPQTAYCYKTTKFVGMFTGACYLSNVLLHSDPIQALNMINKNKLYSKVMALRGQQHYFKT